MPLKFECNKIDVNPKEYWEEVIQLTFLNDKSEYFSLTRLPDEDEVYFEYNDQINFLYSKIKDIIFKLEENIVTIEVPNPIKGNLPNTFIINIIDSLPNYKLEALRPLLLLVSNNDDDDTYLTEEAAEMDRRVADFYNNPSSYTPLEDVLERYKEKYDGN
jgi:hypothetical protein